MNKIDTIMHHLTGRGLIEALTNTLRENDPEFVEAEVGYQSAIEQLRTALPSAMTPTLDEFIAAHERDIISRVAYAGYLGYRVNLENFHHPIGIDFVKLDTIDYIKDHLFGHFPVCYEAERIFDAYYKALPEALRDTQDPIDSYFCFLECSGPKLAHYAGYIIANHLLPWVEPGYRADWHQTDRFTDETKKYMGYLPV